MNMKEKNTMVGKDTALQHMPLLDVVLSLAAGQPLGQASFIAFADLGMSRQS